MIGDFICSSANDGTHYFRPVSARAEVFWKENNFTQKYVIDNTTESEAENADIGISIAFPLSTVSEKYN